MIKGQTKGIIYLLITAIIWGGSFISQYLGGEVLGAFTFNTYRCVFGCLAIFVIILFDNYFKTHIICFFRKDEPKLITIKNSFWCGIVLFFAMITQQIGVQGTTTAKAGLIAALEVVCVPILMLILYRRKIRLITWIFIITSMIGIMILSAGDVSGINMGDVWVFVSTILYSITIIQVPKYVRGIDPIKFSFFRFVIIGIMGFACAVIAKDEPFSIENLKIAKYSILYSGIFASGVAYTFQILGQKYCDPIIATLIMSLEGIFAAIFGWILLGQSLNFFQITGILLTFISIIFVQITENNKKVYEIKKG